MEFISFDEFTELVDSIAAQVSEKPDVIICLSTGGFIVGATLAKQIGVPSQNLIGLPVVMENGFYRLDNFRVGLKGSWDGVQVLVVDDFSNRGLLIHAIVNSFQAAGAKARGCVLVSNSEGKYQPEISGLVRQGPPPHGWWEVDDEDV